MIEKHRIALIVSFLSAAIALTAIFFATRDPFPEAEIVYPNGNCEPGADGADGAPGQAGQAGQDGQDGTDGAPGQAGQDGQDGTDGAPGQAGQDGQDGTDGAPGQDGQDGQDGTDGADGAPGSCASVPYTALATDLVPSQDNVFSLGTAGKRWKSLQLGPGTLYLQDVITGIQAGLTVSNGSLLIDGAESISIGNIRLTANGIESLLPSQDIEIGSPGDTGYLKTARGIKFPDGTTQNTATLIGETGPRGATGATGATGPMGPAGGFGSSGSFYSMVDQLNQQGTVPIVANPMRYEAAPLISTGVTIVDESKITIQNAGMYNIQFSAEILKTDGGTDTIDIWLRKNGTDVPWTNSFLSIVDQNTREVASWNFMVPALAGDQFQIMWYSPDRAMKLAKKDAITVGIPRPAVPSVILTVDQVG